MHCRVVPAPSTMKQQHQQQKQADHFEYEFFGPYGPALLVLALPCVVLGLVYACNSEGCLQLSQTLQLPLSEWVPSLLPGFPSDQPLYSHEAMAAVVGWFLLVLLLHVMLPGEEAQGVLLPSGRRLTYKLNAFRVFAVTYGTAAALSFGLGVLDLTWLATNFLPLTTAAILFSSGLAVAVYAASFAPGRLLAHGGTSGFLPYDFWMGRELNPRVWGIDVKEFCELYPGMIGWGLLNLAFAYQQWVSLGRVSNSMLLVNLFELWYIADGLFNEKAILTTMDITTDGFGFMLSFGDLAWVPFTFSTQARYLADHPQVRLSALGFSAVVLVQLLGYKLFRGANGQKDAFRRDPGHPSVAHLKSMPTQRGTRLLISGYWGMARHINYLGDWIMGLAWCLPCGFGSIVPYFYSAYFASLLVHRERRDEAACRAKYGADWDDYCLLVPWRIVPYVY